jgi:hypothetical protein
MDVNPPFVIFSKFTIAVFRLRPNVCRRLFRRKAAGAGE